jgi:hypothetical protein
MKTKTLQSRQHIRWLGLCAALSLALCAPSPASAETVETSAATTMHKHPGESTKVVLKLRPGARLRVLSRKGRWVRVRVGKRVGWVTRTTVRSPGNDDEPESTPTKWGKRRAEALDSGDAAPSPTTYANFGKTVEVSAESPTPRRRRAPDEPPAEPLGPSRIGVRAGMQSISMSFSSDGAAGYGNFRISARAMTAAIAGRLLLSDADSDWHLAVDGSDRVGYSSPGIRYASSTGEIGDIPFSTHEANAGLSVGYRVADSFGGTVAAARIGVHYGVFSPHDIYNHGKLPRESLTGATAGLRFHLPILYDGLSLAIEADVLLAGQRAQTTGLEDGTVTEVSAAWGGATFSYPLSRRLGVQAGYRFGTASTTWEGPSARQPDATEASREDREHLLAVGLAYGL